MNTLRQQCYHSYRQRLFVFSTSIQKEGNSINHRVGSRSLSSTNATENDPSLPSLKRLLSPFLFQCHPDRSPRDIPVIRKVNLNAVQTLFQMIDIVENKNLSSIKSNIDKAKNSSSTLFDIEFMVPTMEDENDEMKKKKSNPLISIQKKGSKPQLWTRRSVELTLSNKLLSSDRSRDQMAQQRLHNQAQQQIVKLLRVAGLHAPADSLQDQINTQHEKLSAEDYEDEEEAFLNDELGLGPPQQRRSFMDSPFQKSKRQFVKKFDFAKHHELYQKALQDAEADIATSHQLYGEKRHEERKHRFIAKILSRLVMDPSCLHQNDDESNFLLLQLIAIRRMSLIFYDYFDELEMHEFGKFWEEMIIVLLPSRHEEGPLRKSRKKGESGFKFSLDSNDKITAHVPIDFTDDEIVREFKAYLHQVWSMQVHDGVENFYPSYWKKAVAR